MNVFSLHPSLSHCHCSALTTSILCRSTLVATHPMLTTTRNSPKRSACATPNWVGINYTLCTDAGDADHQRQRRREKEEAYVGAAQGEAAQAGQEVAPACLPCSACPSLSLPASACLCLSLPVSACLCLCLSLPVPACLCLSLPVSACLCMSLPASACLSARPLNGPGKFKFYVIAFFWQCDHVSDLVAFRLPLI